MEVFNPFIAPGLVALGFWFIRHWIVKKEKEKEVDQKEMKKILEKISQQLEDIDKRIDKIELSKANKDELDKFEDKNDKAHKEIWIKIHDVDKQVGIIEGELNKK